jgi:hypothetical protein
MNVSWILQENLFLDPVIDVKSLRDIGSFWGSWRTWRAYGTDNVICHDLGHAENLINRNFQNICNFYISDENFATLGAPTGAKRYQGNFIHDVNNREDIIAMHFAASQSEIVLMLGFDWSEPTKLQDKLLEHRAHNYRSLTKQVIIDNPQVQWLLIDHPSPVRKDLQKVENLSTDTLKNVLELLSS